MLFSAVPPSENVESLVHGPKPGTSISVVSEMSHETARTQVSGLQLVEVIVTARQQGTLRVFMENQAHDGCTGIKLALPSTFATPMPCCE